jgi:hypothetical protein
LRFYMSLLKKPEGVGGSPLSFENLKNWSKKL